MRKLTPIDATIDEVQAVAEMQGWRCAICNEKLKLHVDHDHVTGRFRGLLCNQCNLGLGQFKDDPVRLQAAINYLGVV